MGEESGAGTGKQLKISGRVCNNQLVYRTQISANYTQISQDSHNKPAGSVPAFAKLLSRLASAGLRGPSKLNTKVFSEDGCNL